LVSIGYRLGAPRPLQNAAAPAPAPEGPSAQAKAARFIIDEISKTMTNAEIDRKQGSYPHRDAAMEAARAAASASEVITDRQAADAVLDWKDQWDYIPRRGARTMDTTRFSGIRFETLPRRRSSYSARSSGRARATK
jgi:hypothetical protein